MTRDRRTTRLIKGVTLSTFLSLIFAPALLLRTKRRCSIWIERVVLSKDHIRIRLGKRDKDTGSSSASIEIPRDSSKRNGAQVLPAPAERQPNQRLLQTIVRAHTWLADLASGRYRTIEDLAGAAQLHKKVVRQGLRLAFLAPHITATILEGTQPPDLTLSGIPNALPLAWAMQ